MTINVVMVGSTIHVLVDRAEFLMAYCKVLLKNLECSNRLMWIGAQDPPSPQPLGNINRQPVGVVQVAALI